MLIKEVCTCKKSCVHSNCIDCREIRLAHAGVTPQVLALVVRKTRSRAVRINRHRHRLLRQHARILELTFVSDTISYPTLTLLSLAQINLCSLQLFTCPSLPTSTQTNYRFIAECFSPAPHQLLAFSHHFLFLPLPYLILPISPSPPNPYPHLVSPSPSPQISTFPAAPSESTTEPAALALQSPPAIPSASSHP